MSKVDRYLTLRGKIGLLAELASSKLGHTHILGIRVRDVAGLALDVITDLSDKTIEQVTSLFTDAVNNEDDSSTEQNEDDNTN